MPEKVAAKTVSTVPSDDPFASYQDFKNSIGESWLEPLKSAITSPEFEFLFKFVKKSYANGPCFPPKKLIFNAYQQA